MRAHGRYATGFASRRAIVSIAVAIAMGSFGELSAGADAPLHRLSEEACRALRQAYAYDRTIPLEARIVERRESDRSVREKIVFRGAQGFLVPGYLERPATIGPHPCVLLLHGWSGSKTSWWQQDNYISGSNLRNALLADGFAIMALDAQCHGERVAENDYALPNPLTEPGEEPRKGYFTQQQIYVQTVIDYRRALDYLDTRDDIDLSRAGVAGYSMGGTQVFPLMALEPRLRTAVACVVPAERDKWSLIAPQNHTRAIKDRPVLMVMGRKDSMCPPEQAEALFEFLEGDASRLMFLDAGHRLPVDYVQPAVEWIARHLGAR